ncbi:MULTISPECIES: hypothetical protein [Pseudomonas]|uniref:Ribbon-helix-helix protein, CopG family n=1 Tax=Pseudomonas asiatica TaxID=2219225 RepID=A0ABU5KW01_9PSED|nr:MULTISPECIES: hypothetical protein [Pseudomonas]MCO8166244.1 hypothetical protein [Pseudomonas sp. 21LCFQ02]MDZ5738090.1 hypothetical protein [Pseudomonas asiatica]MDZ5744686.1 hypothetical protein [Pseudomonas asiatica]MDZ5748846.1 hypothetical protein [Pseudomonas asiatica]MDZ5753178.1 hypothetical protein [Pseudomonas asiatica]
MAHAEKAETFLVRLRPQDTPSGVSISTVEMLMSQTGLNRTEVVHLALRELANRWLPRYEEDDGPLTDAQYEAILAASPATDTPEELFTQRLF